MTELQMKILELFRDPYTLPKEAKEIYLELAAETAEREEELAQLVKNRGSRPGPAGRRQPRAAGKRPERLAENAGRAITAALSASPAGERENESIENEAACLGGLMAHFSCFSKTCPGSRIVKVVTLPVEAARMVPPCSSTISLAMASPRPAPPVWV